MVVKPQNRLKKRRQNYTTKRMRRTARELANQAAKSASDRVDRSVTSEVGDGFVDKRECERKREKDKGQDRVTGPPASAGDHFCVLINEISFITVL